MKTNSTNSTSSTITVIINGAQGRMGSEAVIAINNTDNLKLLAGLTKEDNLVENINTLKPDVVLDLTNANSVYENTKNIIQSGSCPVIGSSGLLEEQITELQILAKEHNINGIIVPNFSIGAVLMMHFSRIAAKYFDQAEIIERHHPNKLDAPSGTAIRTADLIAANTANKDQNSLANNQYKELIPHALGANYKNIPIHSLRLSGSVAHQTVIFGGTDETLSLQHDSIHRKSFMPGVVLACQKVQYLNGLNIGLECLLEL